ncbi:hypothetical protein [Acidiferrobacter sp.]|uniref:hypothetical protein n=1 Tax=Acidiferrobacter sp. TaxID=1872107 RepID=UPI00261E456D|nr:hypothetical protein [Acidiferrobacter sp.]
MTPTLYQFFHRHVQYGLRRAGLGEPETVAYVSDLLARFAHTDALYPLNDQGRRPLTTIVQFRVAQQAAQDMDRAREMVIVRHLAEYTLFMSSVFRERLRSRGQLAYYTDQGRSAFGQTADLEKNSGRARVYWRLGHDFARVAQAVDDIRHHQLLLAAETYAQRPLAALWRR